MGHYNESKKVKKQHGPDPDFALVIDILADQSWKTAYCHSWTAWSKMTNRHFWTKPDIITFLSWARWCICSHPWSTQTCCARWKTSSQPWSWSTKTSPFKWFRTTSCANQQMHSSKVDVISLIKHCLKESMLKWTQTYICFIFQPKSLVLINKI